MFWIIEEGCLITIGYLFRMPEGPGAAARRQGVRGAPFCPCGLVGKVSTTALHAAWLSSCVLCLQQLGHEFLLPPLRLPQEQHGQGDQHQRHPGFPGSGDVHPTVVVQRQGSVDEQGGD